MRATLLFCAAALLVAGCGAASPAPPVGPVAEAFESSVGPVVSTEFPSGLECDVFDTTKGGGVDCNFAAFQVPSDWADRTGEIEALEANEHQLALLRFADGHLCVVADGTKSGGITCHYPPN